MLLTISTTHQPATDLGYLLHKNPARLQTEELSFGKAYVFYPDASINLCTAVRTRAGVATFARSLSMRPPDLVLLPIVVLLASRRDCLYQTRLYPAASRRTASLRYNEI